VFEGAGVGVWGEAEGAGAGAEWWCGGEDWGVWRAKKFA